MNEITRILFIRTDRIGDSLMNLPAIRALRQRYPKAWISLMVDKSVADLFNEHPDIDESRSVDSKELNSGWLSILRLANELRRAKYDAAIVSNPNKTLHLLVWLAGIPIRVGYRRKGAFFLNKTLKPVQTQGVHEIQRNLQLASLLSPLEWDGHVELGAKPETIRQVASLLEGFAAHQWIAIHPGSSDPRKRWSDEKFRELAERLLASGRHGVVVVGGAEERATGDKICGGTPNCLNLCGRLTLKELSAFFAGERVRLLVSTDSGPLHVAWMSGTPVMGMYAADLKGSDPTRWGPLSKRAAWIHQTMAAIGVDEVEQKCRELLNG